MIDIIIMIIGCAILAIEIAYNSELAYKIKQIFFLDKEHKAIKAASQLKFWYKLIPYKFLKVILYPLYAVITLMASIYLLLMELFNCPYCLSAHLGFWSTFILGGATITMAIYYGLMTILAVHLIEHIYNK